MKLRRLAAPLALVTLLLVVPGRSTQGAGHAIAPDRIASVGHHASGPTSGQLAQGDWRGRREDRAIAPARHPEWAAVAGLEVGGEARGNPAYAGGTGGRFVPGREVVIGVEGEPP